MISIRGICMVLGLVLMACSDGAPQAPSGAAGAPARAGSGLDVVAVVTQAVAERPLQMDIEAVGTARAGTCAACGVGLCGATTRPPARGAAV